MLITLAFLAGVVCGLGLGALWLLKNYRDVQRDNLAVLAAISKLLVALVDVLEQMCSTQGGEHTDEQ